MPTKKTSKWITHVKAYAKANNCSYGDAMVRARPSYKSQSGKGIGSSRNNVRPTQVSHPVLTLREMREIDRQESGRLAREIRNGVEMSLARNHERRRLPIENALIDRHNKVLRRERVIKNNEKGRG